MAGGGGAPTQSAAQGPGVAPSAPQQAPQQAMPQQMMPQQDMQRLSPQVAQQQFAQQRMMPQQFMQPQLPQQFMQPQLPQQFMQQVPQQQGIQQLLNNMLRQYQPQQQYRAPIPQYGRQAQMGPLAYRPDMSNAQAALSRVKPSVYKTDLDNANQRVADLQSQLEALQKQQQDAQRSPYQGGGD